MSGGGRTEGCGLDRGLGTLGLCSPRSISAPEEARHGRANRKHHDIFRERVQKK